MVVVENVTVMSISTIEELNNIIQKGSERRHISGTQMNEESSRSHLILSIVIESTNLQSQSVARGKVFFTTFFRVNNGISIFRTFFYLGLIIYLVPVNI